MIWRAWYEDGQYKLIQSDTIEEAYEVAYNTFGSWPVFITPGEFQ